MKAFLQSDDNGLFYRAGDQWVPTPHEALAFSTPAEAEHFRSARRLRAHPVMRIDPTLLERFRARAPGAYQKGE
jgi:hypothetical protein